MTTTTAAPTQQTSEAKAKHTPGPWRTYEAIGKKTPRYVVHGADMADVCEVTPHMPSMREAAHADARLIAQAPAMFDVLVKLAGNGGCDAEGLGWAIADARAILAAIDGSES